MRPELEAALDELGEKDREAVLLRFFEGKAFGEIGAALRVSEDAARVRVNRALERMRGLLAKRGVTSTAVALGGLLAGNAAVAAPAGLAASVTGAGILTFMTTTKLVTGVACVVAALAVGTAVWERSRASRAQDEIGALRGELQNFRLQVDALSKEIKEQEIPSAASASKRAEARVVTPVGEKTPDSATSVFDDLYKDPRYIDASLRRARAELPFIYGPLYRRLKLSADQISAFEKAVIEMQTFQSDVFAAARSQGLSLDDPNVGTLVAEAKEKGWESLRAAIGAENVEAYKMFGREKLSWKALSPLLVEGSFLSNPLNAAQADELVRLAALHQVKRVEGGRTITQGHDWDAITTALEKSFSADQLGLVKAYGEKESAELEAYALQRAHRKK